MQAFGLTEFIPFIYAPHVSGSILFPSSPCFLHFPSPSAITVVAGSIRWIAVWGGLIHIWRPEITDVCDISHLLIWQEIFSFHSIMWEPEKVYMQMLRLSNPIQQPSLQTNWKCIAASFRKCTPFLGLCWILSIFLSFYTVAESRTQLSDWSDLIWSDIIFSKWSLRMMVTLFSNLYDCREMASWSAAVWSLSFCTDTHRFVCIKSPRMPWTSIFFLFIVPLALNTVCLTYLLRNSFIKWMS